LNNTSKINIENENTIQSQNNQWISLPITLGDKVILKILELIEKNIFYIENISRINTDDTDSSSNNCFTNSKDDIYFNDENNNYSNSKSNKINKNTISKRETILADIINNDLINKLFWLLVNGSYTKKDTALVILLLLSKSKMLMNLMKNKASIKLLVNHIKGFKITSKININNNL